MKNLKIIFVGILLIPLLSMTIGEIELESKSLLNNRVELKIPKTFVIMSEELMKIKYPSDNRPTLIYSDESGEINLVINLTPANANQDIIEPYLGNFVTMHKDVYPSAEWKDSGIKEINGQKVGYLKLIISEFDTKIYKVIFFTDLDGKLLHSTFKCNEKSFSEWEQTADKIMNSLKIK
ncbi:hypothetical protein ADIWIN_3206 [Winogradskyella psychrotolerans RS-3]|uniref:Uncharacterized protein n=2 Tax=Winogradskyella TaxID=286104 RepID=S7VMY3_9FLAO|nr:hypothetical protein ADIWIN_3206 [Winogradskyella psychrotolerans RS-3]